jgi:hypothetical protein
MTERQQAKAEREAWLAKLAVVKEVQSRGCRLA